MRVDMSRPDELHRLIRIFLDYELPQIEEFRKAQQQFKTDLPTVLGNLRETIEEAEAHNLAYQTAAAKFLSLCQPKHWPCRHRNQRSRHAAAAYPHQGHLPEHLP